MHSAAADRPRFIWAEGKRRRVHFYKECRGVCPFHGPSRHHMRAWPIAWHPRLDGVMRVCPHGCLHPDPDWRPKPRSHGCDGCCIHPPDVD